MICEMKGFNEFVERVMEEEKAPGLAVAVVRDGKIVFSQGFGLRDVKNSLSVTPETLFTIGSCTKALTATAMGILVDEGRLDWDKPVREYLPAFRMHDPYATEYITPRDIAIHRSGLPGHTLMWYGAPFSRDELFDRLRYLEPNKEFRYAYQYSNLMYAIAGYMVGQIAGSSWEELVRQRIFGPLGMENSNFSVMESQKSANFALPYVKTGDEVRQIPFRNIDAMAPAGSIGSSASDMIKWVLLNLNSGKFDGKQIVSEDSLKQIHSPQIAMPGDIKYSELLNACYGMGWVIQSYRGRNIIHHRGDVDGLSAEVSMMPQENIGMVVLANLNATPITNVVAFNVYDRLLGLDEIPWYERIREEGMRRAKEASTNAEDVESDRKTGTQPSHPLEDYTGDFEHPGYGIMSIRMENGRLKIALNAISATLEHYHYDVFSLKTQDVLIKLDTRVNFFTDIHGNVNSLIVLLESAVNPIVFTRRD